MHLHNLDGCAPTPLAHYLKALGILRLVSEQADPEARGWWDGDRYLLYTTLDRDELLTFFLDRYEPTPIVSPWLKGSGFYYQEDPGLTPIEKSTAHRLASLRSGIAASRSMLEDLSHADDLVRHIKAEAKDNALSASERKRLKESPEYKARLAQADRLFKEYKAEFIPNARKQWRGKTLEWMNAAMVLDANGEPKYPALLGTGGNDGRLDFTNNFYQRLNEVFDIEAPDAGPRVPAPAWFTEALWGTPTHGMRKNTVGQFLPGFVGGANNDNGPTGESISNPVDFLLMLEGAVLFSSHATRRMDSNNTSRASAPFAISAHGAGYGSVATTDESARGEQWMPLWDHALSLPELKHLLSEGRAQIGRHPAREPLDLSRAVARLGTARGIRSFQRYGYIERNGQSNLAVPIGRFVVPDHLNPRLSCLDDLDGWLPRLRRTSRNQHAPARLKNAERRLSDELFGVTQHPDDPLRWQAILRAMARIEAVHVRGTGYEAGAIPPLRSDWVIAADDGSPEFRLALAFALQAAGFRGPRKKPIDSIRKHWIPLREYSQGRYETSGTGSQTRLLTNPSMVIGGRRPIDDAIAVVERRLVEAGQRQERRLPLQSAPRTAARIDDIAAMVGGEIDLDRTLQIARALMALDGNAWASSGISPSAPPHSDLRWPDDGWITVRLAMLPWPLKEGRLVGSDPAILRRLQSGDAQNAVQIAVRRLRAAGIRPTVRGITVPNETARMWAAALAFPISHSSAVRLLKRIEPNLTKEKRT